MATGQGESRIMQLIYLVFCVITAVNFVHATGLFNMSTHGTYDTSQISVMIVDAQGNAGGDIANSIAYGAGGGIWWLINFLWNFPFPAFMIIDMLGSGAMVIIIAAMLNAVWGLLLALGVVEVLSGRALLT